MTRPRPSPVSRSSGTVGAVPGSIRANVRMVLSATSGPRRSTPHAVTNLVVNPARAALVTRLAAAVTPRSNPAASAWASGWVSKTTVQRWRPSTVCSRTISSSVRADAFQWIERGSSPSVYSRSPWKSPGPSRRALSSSALPRAPRPRRGMSSAYARGATVTSSMPATDTAERAIPRGSRSSTSSGPSVITPRCAVGSAYPVELRWPRRIGSIGRRATIGAPSVRCTDSDRTNGADRTAPR
jgi:hypothetical protein